MGECEICRLATRKHQRPQCAHPAVVHMHGGQWPPAPSSALITSVSRKTTQPLFFLLSTLSSFTPRHPFPLSAAARILYFSFRFPLLPTSLQPVTRYSRRHTRAAHDYTFTPAHDSSLLLISPLVPPTSIVCYSFTILIESRSLLRARSKFRQFS